MRRNGPSDFLQDSLPIRESPDLSARERGNSSVARLSVSLVASLSSRVRLMAKHCQREDSERAKEGQKRTQESLTLSSFSLVFVVFVVPLDRSLSFTFSAFLLARSGPFLSASANKEKALPKGVDDANLA